MFYYFLFLLLFYNSQNKVLGDIIKIGVLCCKRTFENTLIYRYLSKRSPTTFVNPKKLNLDGVDLILSRIERDYLEEGLKALEYIEKITDIRVINPRRSVEICQNKYSTYKELKEYMPTSILVSQDNLQDMEYLIEDTGLRFPLVLKPVYGGYGNGVLKLENREDLKDLLSRYCRRNPNNFIIQEYIPYRHDLRAFVIGDRIVCTMERIPKNDWRANCSLGAETRRFYTDGDIEDMVLKCVKRVGAHIVGVDVLIDMEGNPYILEMNITPQFRNIMKYSNIPLEILRFVEMFYDN